MMQPQFVGPVMVNGQLMNLYSFSDFFGDVKKGAKSAGQFMGDVADAGRQVSGAIDQMQPAFNSAWSAIDKDSYNKYGGAVQQGLDLSKQTWG